MKNFFYLFILMVTALFFSTTLGAQATAGPIEITFFSDSTNFTPGAVFPIPFRQGEPIYLAGTYGNPENANWVSVSYEVYNQDWSETEYTYTEYVAIDTFGTFDGMIDYKFTLPVDAPVTDDFPDGHTILQVRVDYTPEVNTFWYVYIIVEPGPTSVRSVPALRGLEVFPNPVTDGFVKVETPRGGTKNVKIMDAAGKTVYSNRIISNMEIDIQTLPSGFYLMTVEEEGEMGIGKLVVE